MNASPLTSFKVISIEVVVKDSVMQEETFHAFYLITKHKQKDTPNEKGEGIEIEKGKEVGKGNTKEKEKGKNKLSRSEPLVKTCVALIFLI